MEEGPGIKVLVLEKEYSGLHALGVPLPLCIHLQELGVKVSDALWSTRQSNSGFSVTFFWPWSEPNGLWLSPPPCPNIGWVRPKKRRRRRKRSPGNKNSGQGGPHTAAEPSTEVDVQAAKKSDVSVADNNSGVSKEKANSASGEAISVSSPGRDCSAHSDAKSATSDSVPQQDDVDSDIDLDSCTQMVYEARGGEHGVKYKKDGRVKWTPVMTLGSESESELSDSAEISVKKNKTGQTFLRIDTGNARWGTPIAARTRKKTRIKNLK